MLDFDFGVYENFDLNFRKHLRNNLKFHDRYNFVVRFFLKVFFKN